MKWQSFYNEKTGEIKIAKAIAYIFVLGIFIFMLVFGFNLLTRPARTAAEVSESIFSGDNVIYNYEWFHSQYQTVLATKGKIANANDALNGYVHGLPSDPNEWDYTQRKEYDRLQSVLLGIRNIFQDQVALYNARASMVSRNIFKGTSVPDYIDPNNESL